MSLQETTHTDFYQLMIDDMKGTLDTTLMVAERQTAGLTHEDTLVQLPFRGNCMNWILGHIISSRDRILNHLDQPLCLSEHELALYRSGSEPLQDGANALRLERLMDDLRRSTTAIKQALEAAPQETLLEIADTERRRTRLALIRGLLWHETYHVGQLEILRQAAGKNDKIF